MNREDVAKRNASIVRDMRNGMRIRDVMKKYDVSRYTCYRTMQSVNRKERQANYSDWKAKRDEEIVNRYADGVPAEQLAKEYSVHRATIYHEFIEFSEATGISRVQYEAFAAKFMAEANTDKH